MRTRTSLGDQRGSALVVAMLVTVVMLLMGLAALSLADGQGRLTGTERARESTFNLVDAVLKSQVHLMSQSSWPAAAAGAYPTSCSASSTGPLCPDGPTVAAQFISPDYSSGIGWTTQVQDNGGGVQSYYATAAAAGQPGYDANGDGKLWVRAQATVGGGTRVLVAQVRPNTSPQPFPRNVITGGHFSTNNNGKKVIVNTQGNAAQPAALAVRGCTQPAQSSCLNYPPGKGQVSPPTAQPGYTGGDALSSDQRDALRSVAKSNGTYYSSGCPGSITGAVVFIESGTCSYNGGGGANLPPANPGLVVIATGTLSLGGNFTYYGVVYGANLQRSTGNVVSLGGTSQVVGSVAVDGDGGVLAGSSKQNIVYDPSAFNAVVGYDGAEIVPGTWRELTSTG